MEYKYVPMDPSWKKCSDVAPDRKALAEFYRKVRADNPKLARAFYRRFKHVREQMKRDMMTELFSPHDGQGLS